MTDEYRRLFPRMPDEVFDVWIDPLLTYFGIDAAGVEKSFADDSWRERFADRTFQEWSQFGWERRSYPFDEKLLHPLSLERATSIAEHATRGVLTSTSDIKHTAKRFWVCASHIRERPRSYTPVVSVFKEGRFYLVDGHHRLAAIKAQPHINGVTLETWFGSRAL